MRRDKRAQSKPSGGRWPVCAIGLLLYPFASAAVAINVFMLALLAQAIGWRPLTPVDALLAGSVLGIPAAWWSAKQVAQLIDDAEGNKPD